MFLGRKPVAQDAAPDAEVEAQAPPSYEGDVNRVSPTQIDGWAWDAERPTEPIYVLIRSDLGWEGGVVADRFRPDLLEHQKGDGRHAFSFAVPDALRDGRVHQISMLYEDSPLHLKRGAFPFGPYGMTEVAMGEGDAATLASDKFLVAETVTDYGTADLKYGRTYEFTVKLGASDEVAQVSIALTGLDRKPKHETWFHTFEAGLKRSSQFKLHKVAELEGADVYKGAVRLLAKKAEGQEGRLDMAALPPMHASVRVLVEDFREEPVADARVYLPLSVNLVSPLTINMMDVRRRSRDLNNADMALASRRPVVGRLADSFPGYIPPRLAGVLLPETRDDLSAVGDAADLDLEDPAKSLADYRPDLLLFETARLSRETALLGDKRAALQRALDTAALLSIPVAVLHDGGDESDLRRLDWLLARADVLVNSEPSHSAALARLVGPGTKVLELPPSVSLGRCNPFRTPSKVTPVAQTEATDLCLLDGFWDLLELEDEAVRGALLAARDRLHVVDSRFNYSVYRATDAEEFYWNVLGCLPAAERPSLLRRYDRQLLLPDSAAGPSERRKAVLEAAASYCLPTPVHGEAGRGEFDGLLAELWGDEAPERVDLSTDLLTRDVLRQAGLRAVFRGHNTLDRVNRMLEAGKPALVRNNQRALNPKIAMVLVSKRPHLVEAAIRMFADQSYANKELLVFIHGEEPTPEQRAAWDATGLVSRLEFVPRERTLGFCLNRACELTDAAFVAKMDDDDYYGPDHLSDFVMYLHARNIELFARPIGFVHLLERGDLIRQPGWAQHSFEIFNAANLTGFLGAGGTIIVKTELARRIGFSESRRGGLDSDFIKRALTEGAELALGDYFSFALCRHGSAGRHTWRIDDDAFLKQGEVVSSNEGNEAAHGIVAARRRAAQPPHPVDAQEAEALPAAEAAA